MGGVQSDDDEGGEDVELEASTGDAAAQRKKRLENEAKLRKQMMEDSDDDEVMADAQDSQAAPKVESGLEDDSEAEEESASAPIDVKPEKQGALDEPEDQSKVVVSGGRRRGKRKVMRKKTTRDAEGYLGMLHHLAALLLADQSKSQKKRPSGKAFQRMRPRHQLRRRTLLQVLH